MLLVLAPLALLHALDVRVVVAWASVNTVYGVYALSRVASRAALPKALRIMAKANAVWSLACLLGAVNLVSRASRWAVLHALLESAVVGGFAAAEWRVSYDGAAR